MKKTVKAIILVLTLSLFALFGWGWWNYALTVDSELGACAGGGQRHLYTVRQQELKNEYARAYGYDVEDVVLSEEYTDMEWEGRSIQINTEVSLKNGEQTAEPVCFLGEKISPSEYVWRVE